VSNLINNFTKLAKFASIFAFDEGNTVTHAGPPLNSAHDILSLTTYFSNYQSI